MTHKEWTRRLADYAEAIYDTEDSISRLKTKLWDLESDLDIDLKYSHGINQAGIKKEISDVKVTIKEEEASLEKLKKNRDEWYHVEHDD